MSGPRYECCRCHSPFAIVGIANLLYCADCYEKELVVLRQVPQFDMSTTFHIGGPFDPVPDREPPDITKTN